MKTFCIIYAKQHDRSKVIKKAHKRKMKHVYIDYDDNFANNYYLVATDNIEMI